MGLLFQMCIILFFFIFVFLVKDHMLNASCTVTLLHIHDMVIHYWHNFLPASCVEHSFSENVKIKVFNFCPWSNLVSSIEFDMVDIRHQYTVEKTNSLGSFCKCITTCNSQRNNIIWQELLLAHFLYWFSIWYFIYVIGKFYLLLGRLSGSNHHNVIVPALNQ